MSRAKVATAKRQPTSDGLTLPTAALTTAKLTPRVIATHRQVSELLHAPPDTGPYFRARAGVPAGPRLPLPPYLLEAGSVH